MSQSNYTNIPDNGKGLSVEQSFQAVMELLYADGQWFRLPKILHKIKPRGKRLKSAAYTLAAALNQSSLKQSVLTNEGWCDFSQDRAEEDTGFTPSQQNSHLATLEEVGLVLRRRSNRPCGCREVKVRYRKLVQLICAEIQLAEKPVSRKPVNRLAEKPLTGQRKTYQPIYKEQKEGKEQCRPPNGGSDDAPTNGFLPAKYECSPAAHKDARRLYEKVSKAGLLGSNRSSVKEWGCWLDKTKAALETEERPVQYDELFKFHLAQLGKVGQPEAFCGRSFYEKRVALVRAWSRFKARREEQAQWQAKKEGVVTDQLGSDRRWDTEEDDYI